MSTRRRALCSGPRMDELGAEVGGLFGEAEVVVLTAANTDVALARITDAEAELVARAVDKRKREFATARVLAREALGRIGSPAVEILNAPDRAPIWPEGIAGSISHCDTRAVVAIARRDVAGTVGIDIEHRAELKRELWKSVFTAREIAHVEERFGAVERGRLALALFSAKEALYKAQYPWTTSYMGFHELEVALEPISSEHGTISCTFLRDVGRFARGTVVAGRYRLDAFPGKELVTAVRIE